MLLHSRLDDEARRWMRSDAIKAITSCAMRSSDQRHCCCTAASTEERQANSHSMQPGPRRVETKWAALARGLTQVVEAEVRAHVPAAGGA